MKAPVPLTALPLIELTSLSIPALATRVGAADGREFRLALHRLTQTIREERGIELRIHNNSLVVVPPRKVPARARRFWATGLRKKQRAISMLDHVDRSGLSDAETKSLERMRERMSRQVAQDRLMANATNREQLEMFARALAAKKK